MDVFCIVKIIIVLRINTVFRFINFIDYHAKNFFVGFRKTLDAPPDIRFRRPPQLNYKKNTVNQYG